MSGLKVNSKERSRPFLLVLFYFAKWVAEHLVPSCQCHVWSREQAEEVGAGDDISFFFFLFFFFIFLFYVMLFILSLLIFTKIISLLFYLFIFFMKITFIFSCSGMFRDVPWCSGMFRNVPCSWFYTYPKIQIKNKQASLSFLLVPLSFATYFLFGNNRGHELNYFGIAAGKLEGVFR